MLSKVPQQKQNTKINDNKKSHKNNKPNDNRENAGSFYSYNNPSLLYSTLNDNQFSQKSLHSNIHFNFSNIQTKLKVSQPGDVYEQEAQRVAYNVMDIHIDAYPQKSSHQWDYKINNDKKLKKEYDNSEFIKNNESREKIKTHRQSSYTISKHTTKDNIENSDRKKNKISNNICSSQIGGQPLEKTTREFMEPRFNYDFSNVRIHRDKKADQLAHSFNALAYTFGNNIVFQSDHYSPSTNSGKKLLAHELSHVIQQSNSIDPHKIPQLSNMPNNMISRQEGSTNTSKETTGEIPNLRLPQIGESLKGPSQSLDSNLHYGFHLMPEDKRRIDEYLTQHQFKVGPGLKPMLDGHIVVLDEIVDAVRPIVLPFIMRNGIESYVNSKWSTMIHLVLFTFHSPPEVPPVTIPNVFESTEQPTNTKQPTTRQITLGTGINYAWHITLDKHAQSSNDRTFQIQIGEDTALQRIFQISYNIDTKQVQAVIGVQATLEKKIVGELLKIGAFANILAGIAYTGSPASGTFTVIQPSAGAQLTLTFGPVQIGFPLSISTTYVQDQPTTGEINFNPTLTFSF